MESLFANRGYVKAESEAGGQQNRAFRFSDGVVYRPPPRRPDFSRGPASRPMYPRARSEAGPFRPDDTRSVLSAITDTPRSLWTSNYPAGNWQFQPRDRQSQTTSLDPPRRHVYSEVNVNRSGIISNNSQGNGQIPPPRSSALSNVSLGNTFVDTYSEMPELRVGYDQDPTATVNDFAVKQPDDSKDSLDDEPATRLVKILRMLAVLLIIGDRLSDWWVIRQFDSYSCGANLLFKAHFYKYPICGSDREGIRQLLSVFTVFGSVFGLLQILNIFLAFFRDKDTSKFQLFKPRTELCIFVFLAEFPQAVILLVFGYNCDCSTMSRLYTFLSMLSGFLAATVRYATSYGHVARGDGCCSLWWRCCCCKDDQYLFKTTTHDCFCHCSVPCLLCCCTLNCDNCSWTPHTWMTSLCQTMSCFWGHCRPSEAAYGIRMTVNVGILALLFCLVAQTVLLGLLA